MSDSRNETGVNRRAFLSAGAATVAVPVVARLGSAPAQAATQSAPDPLALHDITLSVNERAHPVSIDARTTLLDVLREDLGLTGSKKGCDHGQCGACTVLVGGQRVLSCLTLTLSVGAEPITTIEGLAADDGTLHPMQQAFIDHDAFQCGYCTPGQIMSAVACVKEGHAKTPEDIREYMSGNICRCAAYPNIVAAIEQAQNQMGA